MFFLAVMGCGDACERLCTDVSRTLQECVCDPDVPGCEVRSLTWEDLGARGRSDFERQCRSDWEQASSDLSSSDLSLHMDACKDTLKKLDPDKVLITCDEVFALYGPGG